MDTLLISREIGRQADRICIVGWMDERKQRNNSL